MTGSAKPSIASAVIASEAKQSILPRKERVDCFVAALLAMTGRVRGGTPHPPPSSPANRPRECAPDDRLREAIHRLGRHCERSEAIHCLAGKKSVDCFVAALLAMTVSGRWHSKEKSK